MANEELIALLKSLQGSGGGGSMNPGLLAQLPSLIAAVAEPPTATSEPQGSTIASAASTVASSAFRGVSGGLTLLPVVSSLLKLFGVGRKEEPPELEKFALPAPIRAEAGLSQSGETFLIDRGVGDRIRQVPAPTGTTAFQSTRAGSTPPGVVTEPGATPGGGATITVNVQAMDSQSFMDRREDIARAVREAMLQSHSLNDVVSEV